MNIERRIKKAEQKLGVDQEPVICHIVHYGGPLPPEERRGNVIVRHVYYSDICNDMAKRQESNFGADKIQQNPTE